MIGRALLRFNQLLTSIPPFIGRWLTVLKAPCDLHHLKIHHPDLRPLILPSTLDPSLISTFLQLTATTFKWPCFQARMLVAPSRLHHMLVSFGERMHEPPATRLVTLSTPDQGPDGGRMRIQSQSLEVIMAHVAMLSKCRAGSKRLLALGHHGPWPFLTEAIRIRLAIIWLRHMIDAGEEGRYGHTGRSRSREWLAYRQDS